MVIRLDEFIHTGRVCLYLLGKDTGTVRIPTGDRRIGSALCSAVLRR